MTRGAVAVTVLGFVVKVVYTTEVFSGEWDNIIAGSALVIVVVLNTSGLAVLTNEWAEAIVVNVSGIGAEANTGALRDMTVALDFALLAPSGESFPCC